MFTVQAVHERRYFLQRIDEAEAALKALQEQEGVQAGLQAGGLLGEILSALPPELA